MPPEKGYQHPMFKRKKFLKDLIALPGLSGYEKPVREMLQETWKQYADELEISPLGSLHGLVYGNSEEPRRRVLLASHMDAIGLMVTQIENGFLRIMEIGGLDDRVLPGQQVIVHGREPIEGVIIQPPSFLLPKGEGNGVVAQEYLLVDTGLMPDELGKKIRIGDLVSFAQPPLDLGKHILAGHSLDNRASVAVLTECLVELKKRSHEWDVWMAATVQEEETMGGALTSAYQIRPDIAIAIDVTWAKGPGGGDEHKTFPMGEGFTLSWGPSMHPGLFKAIKEIADRYELPYSKEVLPRYSGTDADAMQIVREGIPTMVVSIPIRYMHTPVEMISLKDIRRTARLLVEFISSLDADFMDSIKPED